MSMNESEATRGLGLLIQDCDPLPPPPERLRECFAAGADPNIIIHDRPHEDGGDSFPQIMLNDVKFRFYREKDMKTVLASLEQFVLNPMFDIDALNSCRKAVIHIASELDNPDFLRVILRSGRVNVNLSISVSIFDGYTALHLACNLGKVQNVKSLVEDGRVDVDALDSRGRTPLFALLDGGYGSDSERYDIVAMLISRGCDLMTTDIHNSNALHYCRDPDICRLLLIKGVDPLHVGVYGHTPIRHAHVMGCHEVRDLMVKWVNFPRFRAIYKLLQKNDIPLDTLKAIYSQAHPPLY